MDFFGKIKKYGRNYKKEDKDLMKALDGAEFEKGDALALIIAAIMTMIPVVILTLAFYFLIFKWFWRF